MKNYSENKENAKKSLSPVIVIATMIIIILLIIMLVFTMRPEKEPVNETPINSAVTTQQLENDPGSNPYYTEHSWCPNYGYVTGAKNKIRKAGENLVYYTYDLRQEEFDAYLAEIKANNFELNQVSDEERICFNREYKGKTQYICMLISYENTEITIYAEEK